MSVIRRVEISDEAREEMNESFRYFGWRSKKTHQQRLKIKDMIKSLRDGLVTYKLTEEEPWHSEGVHCAVAGEFRLFYEIRGQSIVVTHALHGALDLTPFL